jgi:predicted nucleic-acid-binding Zn-ribbon protein
MKVEECKQDDRSLIVTFDGKPPICVVCGNNRYDERGSLLNTRGSEFFGLAWTADKATNYVCTKCGYIFWFLF